MVNIFENKEKHTFYLISENCSLIECNSEDMKKISDFYNSIHYREDVCIYIKKQAYSSAVTDNKLIDKITKLYAEYREEGNYEWNICLEKAMGKFTEELMKYLNK